MTEAYGLGVPQDERTMATLAHALSILGFIPPLIIFLVKRESRFVSFHALQALLWHIAYLIVVMVCGMAWFIIFFATIAHTAMDKGATPTVGIFLLIPLVWLAIVGGSIINLVLAIVYCIKAGQGEWADYPVFGRMARKILKMGPAGAGAVAQV